MSTTSTADRRGIDPTTGEGLQEAILASGLTDAAIALAAKCSRDTVRAARRGERLRRRDSIARLISVLAPQQDPEDRKDLWTAQRLAQHLGVSAWWVRDRCEKQQIPHLLIARQYRFTPTHVEQIVSTFERPVIAKQRRVA